MTARFFFRLSVMLGGLLAAAGGRAATTPPVVVPPAMFTLPGAAVLAYAQKSGISLESVAGRHDGGARVGDAVVALATSFEGDKQRQWLIRFTVTELNEQEKKEKADDETVLYSSSGCTFRFGTQRVALALETIGPFATASDPKGEPEVKRARAVVDEAFLAIGIHRVNVLGELFSAFADGPGKGEDYNYSFGGTPFAAEKIAAGKRLAERVGLTEDIERSFVGSIPALMEFFQIARETPGIRDILFAILDKPSMWTMVKAVATRHVDFGFSFAGEGEGNVEASAWKLGAKEGTAVPMRLQLFGKPALDFTLYASEPRPPLLTSAGVVGLIAKSVKNPQRFLVLRIVSAQGAAGTETGTAREP